MARWDSEGNPLDDEAASEQRWDAQGRPVAARRNAPPQNPREAIDWRALTGGEREAVGQGMLQRQMQRNALPYGLGYIAEPMGNMIANPTRRRELMRSVQGAWRTAQEIPSLDLPQLGRDTLAAGERAAASLPNLPGQIASNLPQIARALTYGGFEDAARGQQAMDLASYRGDAAGEQEAARAANEGTGHAAATTLAPLFGGGSVVRAAATGAGIAAPFALSRGEGSLQERLPDALLEIGSAAALSGGVQAGVNTAGLFGRVARPAVRPSPESVNTAQAFERANVPPNWAAVRGREAAPWSEAIAGNPVGGNVRANVQRSIDATRAEAGRIAGGYGGAMSPEGAGTIVQQGVRRWANDSAAPGPTSLREAYGAPSRDSSFASKVDRLYSEVLGRIERAEDAMVSGSARGGNGSPMIGQTPQLTTTEASRAALTDILSRVRNENIRRVVADPQLRRFAEMLSEPGGRVYLADLRELRTYVRGLQRTPGLRQGLDDAGLQRLEEALTRDILQSAHNIGGPQAAHAVHRVDTFYRAGMQRIQRALQPFTREGTTPTAGFIRILNLAADGRANADTSALLSLKRALRPDEFRIVQGSLVETLGQLRPGAAGAMETGAFSLENFVTNYAKLSPRGRQILFGNYGGGSAQTAELAAALDNLAYVAGRLKQVRQFRNWSHSGDHMQTVGTFTALGAGGAAALGGNMLPLAGTLATLGSMRLMGEALTNPGFVRWLVRAQSAANGGARSAQAALRDLAKLAATDPALVPIYNELAQQQERPAPAPAYSAGDPARREPQLTR